MDDIKLTEQAVNGSNSAFLKIVETHEPLFHHKSNAALKNFSSGARKEFESDKYSIFWEAVRTFDKDKSKLSTWIANQTFWAAMKFSKSAIKRGDSIILSGDYADPDEVDGEINELVGIDHLNALDILLKRDDIKLAMMMVSEIKSERCRNIVKGRLDSYNNTWAEVSSRNNVSIQGAINIYNNEILKIKRKIQKIQCQIQSQ